MRGMDAYAMAVPSGKSDKKAAGMRLLSWFCKTYRPMLARRRCPQKEEGLTAPPMVIPHT
jgi:hypothetical protein